MPKNCLDGYLTEGCATCPDWANGSNDRGIGCACHFPIMYCPHFSKMYNGATNVKDDAGEQYGAIVNGDKG